MSGVKLGGRESDLTKFQSDECVVFGHHVVRGYSGLPFRLPRPFAYFFEFCLRWSTHRHETEHQSHTHYATTLARASWLPREAGVWRGGGSHQPGPWFFFSRIFQHEKSNARERIGAQWYRHACHIDTREHMMTQALIKHEKVTNHNRSQKW